MSIEEKYLIVSDLDGTFFGPKATILPRNAEAIRAFQEKGGMFTLATGRSVAILRVIFPDAGDIVSGPAILSGGACLYDFKNQVVLDKRDLDKDFARRIVLETKSLFPNAGYRICTDLGFLSDNMPPYLRESLKRFTHVISLDDLENHLDRVWYKLTYSVTPEENIPLRAHLEKYRYNAYISCSSSHLTEILNPNASKGRQIEKLRKLYPGRTILCVGDYDNDLDMLQAADIAACPANANDKVKAVASIHLCDHSEGCIADLIEQLKKQN